MRVALYLLLSLFVYTNVDANKVYQSDCIVSQWFDFSENCKTGYIVRLRNVLKHNVGDGRKCPTLIMIEPCDVTQPLPNNINFGSYGGDTGHYANYYGHENHQYIGNYGYGGYGNYRR